VAMSRSVGLTLELVCCCGCSQLIALRLSDWDKADASYLLVTKRVGDQAAGDQADDHPSIESPIDTLLPCTAMIKSRKSCLKSIRFIMFMKEQRRLRGSEAWRFSRRSN
jgi:hypothetical protein